MRHLSHLILILPVSGSTRSPVHLIPGYACLQVPFPILPTMNPWKLGACSASRAAVISVPERRRRTSRTACTRWAVGFAGQRQADRQFQQDCRKLRFIGFGCNHTRTRFGKRRAFACVFLRGTLASRRARSVEIWTRRASSEFSLTATSGSYSGSQSLA